jgi:hypothetical protein
MRKGETMKKITLDHEYLTIPAGTKLKICNPKWDGDKPKTQFYLEVETTEDTSSILAGTYTVKVISVI